jgi:hypothetical protein
MRIGYLPLQKTTHSSLVLMLCTSRMQRGAGELLIVERIVKFLSSVLGIDKNDGSRRRTRVDQIHKRLALPAGLDFDDILANIAVSASGSAKRRRT